MTQETLVFQVIDWDYCHEQPSEDDIKKFCIRMFGRTKDNNTIYLQADNFKPYFYVELNPNWKANHIDTILSEVKKVVRQSEVDGLLSTVVENKYRFRGFTNYKSFPFLKLIFSSFDAMTAYSYAFARKYRIFSISKKPIKLNIYESNILPVLRFIHTRDLESVGWISVPKHKITEFDNPPTYCEFNYRTQWSNISRVDDNSMAKFIIASYDIECTSGDGSFPQPYRDEDQVIQIGVTLSRVGEDECYERYLLSLNETADIDNATVIWYKTEKELLLGFTELIRKIDPDIITGYNIFGFDFYYLYERSKKLKIDSRFSELSRIVDEECKWVDDKLSSSALGMNLMKYYKMTGRVLIDLMKVVQRDHRLSSYKLDNVASNFIRESVLSLSHPDDQTTFIKTKNTFGLYLDQYVVLTYIESAVENKYNNGQKFKIKELGKDYIVVNGYIEDSLTKKSKVYWCQAKDDISPSDIFTMCKKSAIDRAVIGKYCLQDCVLCNKLIAKLQIIVNNVGMANVCHVPLSYIFLRGQGVKIYSLIAKVCREKNHLIPVLKKKKKQINDPNVISNENKLEKFTYDMNNKYKDDDEIDEDDDIGYEGAIVFVPKPGVYYEPIPVLDFSSLYPSAMIFRNMSHECFVNDPAYDNIPGYKYHTSDYNNNDGTTSHTIFAQKMDGTKGIVPQVLDSLLSQRKKVRKQMESEPDSFKKAVLDGRQSALKVTANSIYGQTGSSFSPVCMKEIAASTTATGREMLQYSRYFIENVYDKLIGLALTDKQKYYEEVDIYYKYFPTWTNITETLEDGTIKSSKIHVNTLENESIPDSKFVRKSIEYEFNESFDEIYKQVFEQNKFKDDKEFISLFTESITKLRVSEQYGLMNCIHKYIINDKGKANKIYELYQPFWNNMNMSSEKAVKIFLKSLVDYSDQLKCQFVDKLYQFVDNNGYTGKNEFFDKFYYSINRIMNGHHTKLDVIYGDTDSVFFCANIFNNQTGEKIKNKFALEIAINLGIWASIMICTILPNPMQQAYEKVLWPFIIQGKKRYVGNLYEKNPNKFYQKSMGIELKRRDNAPIVKYACSEIVNQILNKHSSQGACDAVRNILHNIITGKYEMDKFIITKTLKGNALTQKERDAEEKKPKEQRTYADRTRIVHAVLADRIADRDPGNKPSSNDRIPYMYIETKTEPKLQGDRVETPEYIIANNLKVDYLFYITNQIQTPALKFLDLITKNANDIFKQYIIKEENRKECMAPIAYYIKNDNTDLDNMISFDNVAFAAKEKSTSPKKKSKTHKKKTDDIKDDIICTSVADLW